MKPIAYPMKIYQVLGLLLLFNCGNGSTEGGYAMDDADFEEVMAAPATRQSPSPEQDEAVEDEISRKVVKTGGVNFESRAIQDDYRKIVGLLPQFNAYIENESQNKSVNRVSYDLTIRVPAQGYDTLYNTISNLAHKLDHRYSNMEDVTGRYYDLKSRIKHKKALEARCLELLNKAVSIKDILEIERNLSNVRNEIDRLEGQFKYLSKQVSYSTLQVSFYEVLPYTYEGSSRKGFGARILEALDNGWQGFLTFLVAVATLWPFALILGASIWAFRRVKRRLKRK